MDATLVLESFKVLNACFESVFETSANSALRHVQSIYRDVLEMQNLKIFCE